MLHDCVVAACVSSDLSTLPLLIDFRKKMTAYLNHFEDEVEVCQSGARSAMAHPSLPVDPKVAIEAIEIDRGLFEGRVISLYLAIQSLTI